MQALERLYTELNSAGLKGATKLKHCSTASDQNGYLLEVMGSEMSMVMPSL